MMLKNPPFWEKISIIIEEGLNYQENLQKIQRPRPRNGKLKLLQNLRFMRQWNSISSPVSPIPF